MPDAPDYVVPSLRKKFLEVYYVPKAWRPNQDLNCEEHHHFLVAIAIQFDYPKYRAAFIYR